MFLHLLAVKARESGLGLGYNPVASVTDSLKDGKLFQKGSSYKFPYCESMVPVVGELSERKTDLKWNLKSVRVHPLRAKK